MVMGTLLTWSSAFPAISFGLRHFSPGELSLGRFAVASLCFLLFVVVGIIRLPPLRYWPAIALLGGIGIAAYQLLLGYGMTRVAAGAASVLIALAPAVTSALAVWRLGETLSRRLIYSLVLAFIGAVIVSLGAGSEFRFEPLALLIFGAVICTSIYFVWQKPLLRDIAPLDFTAASIIAGTVVLIPFGLGLPEKLATASGAQIGSLIYLGVAPSFLGYLLWNTALSRSPVSKLSLFMYAQPVLSGMIAWVWLDQVPTILTLLGGVVLVIGVVFGNSQPKNKARRRADEPVN